MKFEEIRSHLEGIPFILPRHAEVLYNFILEKKPSQCLELGFAHGASSCYIAAALDEIGSGHLTCVDLISGMEWQKPSIEELLSKTGLQQYVTVARETTTYNWFLKKKIEEDTVSHACNPIYDFCFIDGSKNWTMDGCAFFLADKLLKENGWILFDDYKWTYAATGTDSTDGISNRVMGEDEINTPHIELIFKLLVMQHPDYSEFRLQDDWWAWAHKIKSSSKKLVFEESHTYKALLFRALRGLTRRFKRRGSQTG